MACHVRAVSKLPEDMAGHVPTLQFSMRLLLSPVTAVTCNEQFEIIDNAAIGIENNCIAFIEKSTPELRRTFAPDETIGGEHLVALPGLVNTHTHAAMSLLRGYADDMPLEEWLHQKIWPLEAHLNPDDVFIGTQLAIAEALRGGTTCVADMYHFYESGAKAYIESGIRACPGGVLLGFLPQAQKRIANAIAFARDFRGAGDGRISPMLAPHSLYTCDKNHWRAMLDGAQGLGVGIQTHVSETRREVKDVFDSWGATPVQTLKNIGALESPLMAAHCVHLDERDFEIMQESTPIFGRTFRVLHNPTSNLKLASGFAPVTEMLRREITVGIGTDGAASNNDLDMWEEMRLAALIHKGVGNDPTAVSAREALQMATIGGARCLGLDSQIGSLEVGKRADIAILNFDAPHLQPRHNVVSHLVYAAKAGDVCATIVDGKILYRNGQLQTLDEAEIRDAAARIAERLVNAVH